MNTNGLNKTDFIIITGLSGSGKTYASQCFEDLGYFCVDNLPTQIIPALKALCKKTGNDIQNVVLVMDVREKGFVDNFEEVYRSNFKEDDTSRATMLFLEANTEVLIKRYTESRRPHPLARGEEDSRLRESIEKERKQLSHLRGLADLIIDTSDKNVHELKRIIKSRFHDASQEKTMSLQIMSFGFRYGVPTDANIVFDIRFLPNPYYNEDLRHLDGTHGKIQSFLKEKEVFNTFRKHLYETIEFLLPRYREEGKAYLNICIGCTAGKHRSVAVCELLKNRLEKKGYSFNVRHRDRGKE